jgi:hypothetical protein
VLEQKLLNDGSGEHRMVLDEQDAHPTGLQWPIVRGGWNPLGSEEPPSRLWCAASSSSRAHVRRQAGGAGVAGGTPCALRRDAARPLALVGID